MICSQSLFRTTQIGVLIKGVYETQHEKTIFEDLKQTKNMIITIKGIPIPKARARIIRRGGISIAYDPQEKQKQHFKILLSNELQNIFDSSDDATLIELRKISVSTALSLDIESYMPLRKSFTKQKRMQKKDNYHNVKPDGSNLFKFVEDSAIGILYQDDALIVKGSFVKKYSEDPRTVINIQCVE